jgi:MYXO-CTERM domain-containing protein
MKKLILALAALMVSVAAYGQGQVAINNRVGTEVVARFILQGVDPLDGTASSIGTPDYSVQFLGGPTGTPISQLQPLNPATSAFRGAAGSNAAGFFSGVTATVPGVAENQAADIVVRVLGPGGLSQDFGPFTATLGGGAITPPNLAMGTSPLQVVPEPGTMVLAALGLGALLAIRRRK